MPAGDVKRLGDEPVVLEFAADRARIEVAASAELHALATGPMPRPASSASGEPIRDRAAMLNAAATGVGNK